MLGAMFFPNPRGVPTDIVAVGGDLDVSSLLAAYRRGIFPWPIEGLPLTWFSPRKRAILLFDEIHVGRTLAKARRKSVFRFTLDTAFRQVIEHCASVPRPDQPGTWITPEIIEAFTALHKDGSAHSVEAWDGSRLVGGMYGVDAGGAFGGESMFHLEPDASRLALLHIIDHLRARGLGWLDAQVMTPHIRALGARDVPRSTFLDLLTATQRRGLKLFG